MRDTGGNAAGDPAGDARPDAPPAPPLTLAGLNGLGEDAFVAALGSAVERSPWVVRRAWRLRPFASRAALADALAAVMRSAAPDDQRRLLLAHPELAGTEARARRMTDDSQGEQARLGLLALDAATLARLDDGNRRYRERFGFPFVIALRLQPSLAAVFAQLDTRLGHDAETERAAAIEQVCAVMRGRLTRLVADPQACDARP